MNAIKKVAVHSDTLQTIKDHSAESFPEECCGFLYGQRQGGTIQIAHAKPMVNEADERRNQRYLISPAGYLKGEKYGDAIGRELVGVYHSHPDHPAIPSNLDLDCAYPGFIYLIVSVHRGAAQEATWWSLSEGRFIELESSYQNPGSGHEGHSRIVQDRK